MIYNYDLYSLGIRRVLDSNAFKNLYGSSILVTGINGLIGSAIVDVIHYMNLYYNSNISIIGTVRNTNKVLDRFFDYSDLKIIEYDINNKLILDVNVNFIIHAASNSHPMKFVAEPVDTIVSSFVGTKNLLDYSFESSVKRFLYISSGEVYGKSDEKNFKFNEDYCGRIDSLNFRSCYPIGKISSENLCVSYVKQFGLDAVIARLCHIYGPTQTDIDSRVSSLFVRNILNDKDIVMKSDGSQVRSYCYVLDAVTGILKILDSGKVGEVYNVSNNRSFLSIKELANFIADFGHRSVKYENPSELEKRSFNVSNISILDGSKLEGIGWVPCYSFEDGMRETIKILKKEKKN